MLPTLALLLLLVAMYREFKKRNRDKHTTNHRSIDERSGLNLTKKL